MDDFDDALDRVRATGLQMGPQRGEGRGRIAPGQVLQLVEGILVGLGDDGLRDPGDELLAVVAFGVQYGDDQVADAARAPDVGREQVDPRGHQQPGHPAAQARVAHHGLDLAGQAALGAVGFLAHAAELGVGLVDEDDHLFQGLQHAPQALEDHVGLPVPLAADVLEHQDGHAHVGGDGLEDEGLAAADGPGHRGAGQGPIAGGPEAGHQLLAQEALEPGEAYDVLQTVTGLLELDDVLAELRLDELLDLLDHVARRDRLARVGRPGEELAQRVDRQSGGRRGQLLGRAPQRGFLRSGPAEVLDEVPSLGGRGGRDLDGEDLRQARDAGMDQAARLGHQAHAVAPVHEGRIAEPVLHDADPPQLGVAERGHVLAPGRQQQVGRLDQDQEVLGQVGPRADGKLPQQLQGEGGVAEGVQQELVELRSQALVLRRALFAEALDHERVRVAARLPGDPRLLELVAVVEDADRAVQLVNEPNEPLGLRLAGQERD